MSRRLTRRTALGAAALLLCAGRTASAQATPVTVRVATSANDDLSALLYAQQSGMLRAAGIELTIAKANNGSFVAAALVGGACDLAKISSVPIITAHARGISFKIVFPNKLNVVGKTLTGALLVTTGSPIQSARDLNGKTIAVAALKDATWLAPRAWMDDNGADSASVQFIEIPFTAMGAALEAGRIHAASIGQPYITAGLASKKERMLTDVNAAIGPRFLQSAWCTTADFAARNPDIVAKLARALAQANAYCNAHAAEVRPLTAAFTGLDLAMLSTMTTLYATEPDPHDMQPWIDACLRYAVIPQRIEAKELYA